MQHKKLVLSIGLLILLAGAAAFIAGTLFNRSVASSAPFADGDFRSIIIPAPELPTTSPEVTGSFVERQDNTILVETKSLVTGALVTTSDTKNQSGPQVEVVITGETVIYRETTQPSEPLSIENQTILQTVEESTLDDLDSQSKVMVWGRKTGDRVIAEILLYSDLVAVKSAIFEDCEICP